MNPWHPRRKFQCRLLIAITVAITVSLSPCLDSVAEQPENERAAASVTAPPVTALAMAPSGDRIVSGSQAGISIYKWPSMAIVESHDFEIGQIQSLRFSPDATRLLIAGGKPSEVGQWQIATWPDLSIVASSSEHDDVIHSAIWLSDDRFVTGAADTEVIQWQMQSHADASSRATIVRRLTGHSRRVLSVESIDRGRLLISAGVDQSLRVWSNDADLVTPLRVLDNHTGIVRDLARRPGDHPIAYLASASADKTVRIWQPSIGRLVRFARLPVEPLCIAWSSDGNQIGVGCIDGKLRIVNANTVTVEQTLPAVNGWAYSILATQDGSYIIGGTDGKLAHVKPIPPTNPLMQNHQSTPATQGGRRAVIQPGLSLACPSGFCRDADH
ncbi:WD40 repeat domain-containing protein [Rubripirellula reticaptiva]|uniref:WD domain, G-beta repeat n=1 Tax=Rubripirellula reticaptiva TaxID=2528013 RepID=A0A5C6F8N4_9BACT|nr:WD40 repeat domain-containing protein [Rubripirellula reticaptiva]TWU57665.1 WD domain, G-beta repeat [Rubripirellula reticaptiva]